MKKSNQFTPRINSKHNRKVYTEDRHHILPRSVGGSNRKTNIVKLYTPVHRSFHRLFGNCDIRGQIKQLIKINQHALRPEFVEQLDSLISSNDLDHYYRDGVQKEDS